MALDSKRKRGSATSVTMPHRSWLAEPDGTLASTDRASLLKLVSAIAPDPPPAPTTDVRRYSLPMTGVG